MREIFSRLLNKGIAPLWLDVKDIKAIYRPLGKKFIKIELFSKPGEYIYLTDPEIIDFNQKNMQKVINHKDKINWSFGGYDRENTKLIYNTEK